MRQWYGGSKNTGPQRELIRNEICAITTRASPSFLRVGQIELYGHTRSPAELKHIVEFAMRRDFGLEGGASVANLKRMVEMFCERQSRLHTEWVRVGYVQGNMNNDNALL